MEMADRDEDLKLLRDVARGIRDDRESLGENRDELTDSLAELHREPRATLEIPESELRWIVNDLAERALIRGSTGDDFRERVKQALAIESGPGGKFHRGGDAA